MGAGQTVPVSNEVDHYYGSHLEPDLINYMNSRSWSRADFMRHSRGLSIIGADGRRWRIYPFNRKARPPYPVLEIPDTENCDRSKLFIAKMPPEEFEKCDWQSVDVTGEFIVHNLKMTGALLKMAHLSLFSVIGYHWVLHDLGGIELGRVLHEHYNRHRHGDENSLDIFAPYRESVKITIARKGRVHNTLEDNHFIIHSHKNYASLYFAISVMLPMNGFVFSVTVPSIDGIHEAWFKRQLYSRMLLGDFDFVRSNRIVHEGTNWRFEKSPINFLFPSKGNAKKIMFEASKELGGGFR